MLHLNHLFKISQEISPDNFLQTLLVHPSLQKSRRNKGNLTMVQKAVAVSLTLFSPQRSSCLVVRIAQVKSVTHMLRPHYFHLIFYMTAEHFQMVAARGTGNAPASVHSHDSAPRRHTPQLIQGRVECTTYRASSKVAGRIVELRVEEGDRVEQGELLYTLAIPELDAKLQQVEALRTAAGALDAATVAGARKPQIRAAQSLWQKAQAGLELARKSYERVRRLHESGVVPAQQLDEARANYEAMRATERAARAEYDLARDGARSEDKEAAAAKVREAEGAVAEVESYIADARVTAPVSGEVSSIIAEAGELVGTGYPVVAILDLNDRWVTFNIRETLLPRIRIGTRMEGYVPALDRRIALRVSYISPEADFATWTSSRTQGGFDIRTFAVKARPEAETDGLRPGMSVVVDWDKIE